MEKETNDLNKIESHYQDGQIDLGFDDDILWQAKTGLDEETLCGAIETLIFMSEKPISLQKIKNYIDEDLPLRLIHESIKKLQEGYESNARGIRIIEVAEGYQFRTKPVFSKYVQNLYKVNALMLTPTALEALGIIAYKQPISRNEVEKIRGVDSSHLIRGLIDKRLVRISGRSEELGRPTTYSTTQEFLEVFNLVDLSGLPPQHELEAMASHNEVGSFQDFKKLVTGTGQSFDNTDLEEIDKLSFQIKSIGADTDFTKSLRLEDKKRIKTDTVDQSEVKSSFDLLEEFILKEEIVAQNKLASMSGPLNPSLAPEVVGDLTLGPFNAPEILDSDFVMIDLDTGKEIHSDTELLNELKDKDIEEKLPGVEMFFDEELIEDKKEKIDSVSESVARKAGELDLDLDFFKDNLENSTD
jgi:segregation and condensation protein B